MIPTNGNRTNVITTESPEGKDFQGTAERAVVSTQPVEPATRTSLRAKQQVPQNRFVILGAGAIVIALLIFVAVSMPHTKVPSKPKNGNVPSKEATATSSNDTSMFPITEPVRTPTPESHQGFLEEQDLERSATRHPRPAPNVATAQSNAPGTLGSIPPFGTDPQWQAPPYQPGGNVSNSVVGDPGKAVREALEKSSLVYVRSASAPGNSSQNSAIVGGMQPEMGLGLRLGTRLRAHLESAASTAVRAPVLAVIEYNYEKDGQIVIPAGALAVGHMQEANRSGYVRIQFDSLMMPDGSSVPIEAVATTLDLRPPKGKVEGKNAGKNALVRSLSGIGEAGAVLIGRGNLNQPLDESDLIRERISNNVGEAGDEEISRLAITQQIVVTIPANTEIYVVLEGPTKTDGVGRQAGRLQPDLNVEQLRQLLQLQRELNSGTSNQ